MGSERDKTGRRKGGGREQEGWERDRVGVANGRERKGKERERKNE